jgi:lysophospholipase L1-like esterase
MKRDRRREAYKRGVRAGMLGFFCAVCFLSAGPLRIMPLGDSITAGSDGTYNGYRAWLREMLTAAGYEVEFVGDLGSAPDRHEGHVSWTIGDLSGEMPLPAIRHQTENYDLRDVLTRHQPDVILMMIGTNDVLNYPGHTIDRIVFRLSHLVDTVYRALPDVTLFAATLTPWADDNSAAALMADNYNRCLRSLVTSKNAEGAHMVFVNMHESILGTEVYEYDVHPHDPGYRKMARYWFVTLKAWLQASDELIDILIF